MEVGLELKKADGTPWYPASKRAQNDYSERRKFKRSCCWLGLRLSKFSSTVEASLPRLPCAWIASIKSVVRPSCSRNIRYPRPHNGAVRNWSPPAPPCETLSAKRVPM